MLSIAQLNVKKYRVARFACTQLEVLSLDELKPGTHVKRRTVGVFGPGNSPIDIITMKKGDESVLLMANSSRPVMRVKYKNLETYEGSLTEPVAESYATA